MIKINERTPFYFIASVSLFVTIVLSLQDVFYSNINYSDFYPNKDYYYGKPIHDNTFTDKLTYYFSQFTHHSLFLLFFYFFSCLLNYKCEQFFKIVAPIAMTVSVLYFYFIFPKQDTNIYQLSYSSFYSHFMIIFLIFGEIFYIDGFTLRETSYCLIFLVTGVLFTYINYMVRGVWTYNMVRLNDVKGWALINQTILVMYLFSLMFYFIKPKKETKKIPLWKYAPFYSQLVNILFVLVYLIYN